ncbi:MAG: pyruvate kinase [Bacteroidales bacterium]|nr:pyruvate kinase [Bacteroidales bacterium]
MKTKIVATLGPASSSKELIREMVKAGTDVFRINFSHGSYEQHAQNIESIHCVNKELKTHIPVLADLQGPKIRIGQVKNNRIFLTKGNEIDITTEELTGDEKKISINYESFAKDVNPGEDVLLDDGKMLLKVLSTDKVNLVKARIEQGGVLSSKKGVNLPNTSLSLPSLTEKDLKDVEFIVNQRVQWIGLSFVRSATDLIELRHRIAQYHVNQKPWIMAKIEKPEALDDIDNIIKEADGLMVARGDLGVEIPLQQVPLIQKQLIKKCLQESKPIIVATQMMEGMMTNIRPTRAEVNDVANSVMDGADALMLSGETSVGEYPVQVVETMQKIISHVESFEDIYYKHNIPRHREERFISDSILYAACEMAHQVQAKAIAAMTHSGYSAIKVSSQRPKASIYVFTNNHGLLSTLNLVWGVKGFYYDKFISTDHTIEDIKYRLCKEGHVAEGDLIINIASTPIEEQGQTNMLKLGRVC